MDLRVRARVVGRRRLAAEGYGSFFDELRDSLYSNDPLQLGAGGTARDEYGSPVATIIPRLEGCTTPEQVRFVIEDEMRHHYPANDMSQTNWAKLASDWWDRWLRFKRTR